MKAKHLFFVCVGALALYACSSEEDFTGTVDGIESVNENVGSTVKMVVPVGCKTLRVDYPTADGIKSIKVNISPVAKAAPGRDVSPITNATVDIASSVDTYVSIYDEDGNLLVKNRAISAASPRTVQATRIVLPEDAVNEYVTSDGPFTYYHSSGVVMFDDGWPNSYTVDGDFNDVVVDYDIETKTVDAAAAPGQTWRECMKVVMHLRAVGGGHPRNVGVILEGLDTRYIDSYDYKLTLGNWNTKIPPKSLSAKVDVTGQHPIITFENINWLICSGATTATYVNSKTGNTQILNTTDGNSRFYNVAPGFINSGGDLFTLTVTFKGKDRSKLSKAEGDALVAHYINAVMDTESQNFYISTSTSTEIHMKGYNPTRLYTNYAADIAKATLAMDNTTTYASKTGYVWGFKTPVLTRHAWEKMSFYKAYPEYTAWVTSGGTVNTDWYKHPDKDKVSVWW